MSGFNRQRNRFGKQSNPGRRMEWKPKPKDKEESIDENVASDVQNLPLNEDSNAGRRMEWKPKPKIDGSLDNSSCSQKDKEESIDENVASDVQNLPLNEDSISNKINQFVDINKKDDNDNNHSSSITRFDICPKKVNNIPKLNAPLHVKNREKRKQMKQSTERQNIIILGPGMVLMKNYISCDNQIGIVKKCRELGISDGGFYQPCFRSGMKLHLQMMCLGKNWDPENSMYSDTRASDNAKPHAIPELFHDMVTKALQDSNASIRENAANADEGKIVPTMKPDLCIVNFYSKSGRLGLHQDKDESPNSLKQGLPVVSFSIGDSAEFLYGEVRDAEIAEKVTLESGDVLIFGGKSRLIFHGVSKIIPDTAPTFLTEGTDMSPGRLNLTFRKY